MFFHSVFWRPTILLSLVGPLEQHIGRSPGQGWGVLLGHRAFWTVIFVCKFLFNLPLVRTSTPIYVVRG
jgi:hypothetical protein